MCLCRAWLDSVLFALKHLKLNILSRCRAPKKRSCDFICLKSRNWAIDERKANGQRLLKRIIYSGGKEAVPFHAYLYILTIDIISTAGMSPTLTTTTTTRTLFCKALGHNRSCESTMKASSSSIAVEEMTGSRKTQSVLSVPSQSLYSTGHRGSGSLW
jgi:hypothetical protein